MTHEYGDPISPEAIEDAASRALELHRSAPDVTLDVHVAQAAKETICACVLDIEDELECGLSGTHAAVLAEVNQRIWLRLEDERRRADDEAVDEASEVVLPGQRSAKLDLAWSLQGGR